MICVRLRCGCSLLWILAPANLRVSRVLVLWRCMTGRILWIPSASSHEPTYLCVSSRPKCVDSSDPEDLHCGSSSCFVRSALNSLIFLQHFLLLFDLFCSGLLFWIFSSIRPCWMLVNASREDDWSLPLARLRHLRQEELLLQMSW